MIEKHLTEDYRWAGIRFGDNHWQNSKIFINTPYIFWIIGRLNYSFIVGTGNLEVIQSFQKKIMIIHL